MVEPRLLNIVRYTARPIPLALFNISGVPNSGHLHVLLSTDGGGPTYLWYFLYLCSSSNFLTLTFLFFHTALDTGTCPDEML